MNITELQRGTRIVETYYGWGAGTVLHFTGDVDEQGARYKGQEGQVWVLLDSEKEGQWIDVEDLRLEGE